MKKYFIFINIIFCACFSLMALAQENKNETTQDPLKSYNQAVFSFNQFLDRNFLKPIAKTYNNILPNPVKKGVSNFFYNIDSLPIIANDILQGEFEHAVSDTLRVTFNSTIGVLGLFDPASRLGFHRHERDFGLTLAKWGWKDSSYIVLPLWGPKTVRDALAMPIDYFLFSAYPHFHPNRTRHELYAGRTISRRAELLNLETAIQQISLDRYAFEKDAYLQRRNYLINEK